MTIICEYFFPVFPPETENILSLRPENRGAPSNTEKVFSVNVMKGKKGIFYKTLLFGLFLMSGHLLFTVVHKSRTNIPHNKERKSKKVLSQEFPEVAREIDSILRREHRLRDFNGSMLVAKNGKTIFQNQYGIARFSDNSPLTDSSAFQLASVSKQFTAVAIMLLAEQGKLHLEDTIGYYFPGCPYPKIKIFQLLNHTSGLPKYFWLAEHCWDKPVPPTNEDMLNLLSEEKLPPFFRPGRAFDYSNTGYFLLATLIEHLSGMSYGEFIKKNIFAPLGMKHSFVYRFGIDSVRPNQLFGYRRRGRRHIKIPCTVNDAITGDKNIYSTAGDLIKWVNGLNEGKIITLESLHKMYSCGETKYHRKIAYGYGFRINEKEGIIYHDGKWNGFRTSIKQFQKDKVTIILLEHTGYHSVTHLINKIHKLLNHLEETKEKQQIVRRADSSKTRL